MTVSSDQTNKPAPWRGRLKAGLFLLVLIGIPWLIPELAFNFFIGVAILLVVGVPMWFYLMLGWDALPGIRAELEDAWKLQTGWYRVLGKVILYLILYLLGGVVLFWFLINLGN